MSDGLFSTVDLAVPQHPTGYRLHHIELYNWGVFDKRVWRLTPDGDTALLTGDIGSGKSTLVDALTTLLLPAHRIAYNKAAGADTKERTLRSYVEGHYKSERIESTGASKAVGLRDHRSYSVILGVFVNPGYDETVTLAQVFHQKDRTGQPDRFFATSPKELSVEADFTDFGSDLAEHLGACLGDEESNSVTLPFMIRALGKRCVVLLGSGDDGGEGFQLLARPLDCVMSLRQILEVGDDVAHPTAGV